MRKMRFLILVFLCQFALDSVIREDGGVQAQLIASACQISPFGTLPTPLLIRSNSFVYPSASGQTTINLDAGETIDLACPGGRILTGGTNTNQQVLTASCVSGTTLAINKANVAFRDITCSTNPVSTTRYTGNTCSQIGREIEIGFTISNSRFVRTMLLCFDEAQQTTLWSYYELVASINQGISGTPRPSFNQPSGFFTISNVDQQYKTANQRVTINNQLGLDASSYTYIQNNNNYFLSRGHLTARSDFFYAAGQNSTFDYLNALPQWQTFNSMNWEVVETDVRDYAESNNVDLRVWTGGWGITTLPHAKTGVQTPLYLSVNGNQNLMPVPDLFWKVVYNPNTQRGVALIGVNNPYKAASEIDRFCDDRSDLLPWLSWRKDDQVRGYSWACTVTAFRRIVTIAPDVEINGLLF